MKVNIGPYPKDHTKQRRIDVRIDKYDSWNVDGTLSYIIIPLLKQLRATKHGSPWVDNEDLPEHMRTKYVHGTFADYRQEPLDFVDVDEYDKIAEVDFHNKWAYVLDEMIWAFEQVHPDNDWDSQYWSRHPEIDFEEYPEDVGRDTKPLRWKEEGECDWEGRQKHQERITNGLKLFGKYYEALWD